MKCNRGDLEVACMYLPAGGRKHEGDSQSF